MFKVNNKDMKQYYRYLFDDFIANLEHILHLFLANIYQVAK